MFNYRIVSRVDGWSAYEVWVGGSLVGYVTVGGQEWGFLHKEDSEIISGEIRSSRKAITWGYNSRDGAARQLLR